jgi:hypothetical protein
MVLQVGELSPAPPPIVVAGQIERGDGIMVTRYLERCSHNRVAVEIGWDG